MDYYFQSNADIECNEKLKKMEALSFYYKYPLM